MIIGMDLGNGYRSQSRAWRMAGVNPRSCTSFDAKIRQAKVAERGKFQFLLLPDGPTQMVDTDEEALKFNIVVMVTLAAVARETSSIRLVAFGSCSGDRSRKMEPARCAGRWRDRLPFGDHGTDD